MMSPGSLKMEIRYSDAQASILVQAKHLSVCHLMDHLIRMLLITSAMPFFRTCDFQFMSVGHQIHRMLSANVC